MRRSRLSTVVSSLMAIVGTSGLLMTWAQGDPSAGPFPTGQEENVRVDLVLVEARVLDRAGRTVSGLTKDDFVLVVSGRELPIDVFAAACSGDRASPESPATEARGDSTGVIPDMSRSTVLLFDYYHLSNPDRGLVLEAAERAVREQASAGEEIMVAALADGLRIEQDFTTNLDAVRATLDRMHHDVTLWAGNYEPLTERAFFRSLSTLMDVLAGHPGTKAVLLYSNFLGPSRSYDLWYWDVAQRAATSRTVIYPIFGKGLEDPLTATAPLGGSAGLTRLANESGGRFVRNTNDLALAYSAAKRDLACRYTIGFYVDPEWARNPKTIRIRVDRKGLSVRAPEVFKAWTEQERRESTLRAAFVQPDRFHDPMVRAHVFPMRPISRGMWSALTVLQFPLQERDERTVRRIDAVLKKNDEVQGSLQRDLEFPADPDAAGSARTVTLYGEARILPGEHELTVALTDRSTREPKTTTLTFNVPEVPRGRVFVGGPVLARNTGEGLPLQDPERLRRRSIIPEDSVLGKLLGPSAGLEPLLVQRVRSGDALSLLWEVCGVDLEDSASEVTVLRRWIAEDGTVAFLMDPSVVALPDGRVRCAGVIESIDRGTLSPGSYRLELSVVGDGVEADGDSSIPVRVTP